MSVAYVLLSEADQQRLGCPEQLRYEPTEITAREQSTLQKAFGFHTLQELFEAMRAMVALDDAGEVTKVSKNPDVFLAVAWLALRQNGHLAARRADEMATELADLDIQLSFAQLGFAADEPEGKDGRSTPTETSTS